MIDWDKILLPKKFPTIRSWQKPISEKIVDMFESGVKYVFAQLPCGIGKTICAEIIRQALKCRSIYLAPSKILQRQVVNDFSPTAMLLIGRNNYPTEYYAHRFKPPDDDDDDSVSISCADCLGTDCHYCDNCPYKMAKQSAEAASVSVLNTAIFLGIMNNAWRVTGFHGRYLTVCDETDVLEQDVQKHITVYLSPYWCRQFKINPRAPFRKHAKTKVAWLLKEVIPPIRRFCAANRKSKDIKVRRNVQHLDRVADLLALVAENMNDYVYDGDLGKLQFRPVWIHQFAQEYMWKHCDRVLLMSGSIISADQMAKDLGIPEGEWDFIDEPSRFDVARRIVQVLPVADMSYKKDVDGSEMAKIVKEVIRLADKYRGEKILVHTVSFGRSKVLERALNEHYGGGREIFAYYSEQRRKKGMPKVAKIMTKEEALDAYKQSESGIILGPSLDRGVDLPHDNCRVCILIKMPHLSLADKCVSKRLYAPGGHTWFACETIRRVVQMVSRGMRAENDFCLSIILDSNFMPLWKNSKHLFPRYFRDNVRFDTRDFLKIMKALPLN